ncbi:hypothetical protein GCM10023084_10230 [Streptomyces lacrimifluminis]|uniref:Uncharacterized protein n=1 Tax=Streptomyces lacrimifluminis TaxID=1500077 RepID=A0A917L8U3_9ACTN|nr:hypothetical protein GCM10012282_49390 [Streptomyces lacrimifluminis]
MVVPLVRLTRRLPVCPERAECLFSGRRPGAAARPARNIGERAPIPGSVRTVRPVPVSLPLDSSQDMGESGHNGYVSDPTTPIQSG